MKTRMFILAALVAVMLVGGFSQGAFAKGGGTKTIISLQPAAGFSNAIGKAKYKVDGSKREFEVEAEHIKKLAGKTVNVFVNGTMVGSAVADTLGQAHLELSTELGNAVPTIKKGDTVQVKKSNGVLIVSGKF